MSKSNTEISQKKENDRTNSNNKTSNNEYIYQILGNNQPMQRTIYLWHHEQFSKTLNFIKIQLFKDMTNCVEEQSQTAK